MTRSTILLFALALILTAIFFAGTDENEFFFIHDEFLSLTKGESQHSFFAYDSKNFGALSTTILFVSFFDRLYYALLYYFGANVHIAQELLYFLKLSLLLMVPYAGFRKLAGLFFSYGEKSVWILCVSLWYTFNTYTLIYWNANGFSFTVLICYALAPLAFYYIHRSLFGAEPLLTDKLKAVLLVYLMSFALPIFLAFVLWIVLYLTVYGFLAYGRRSWENNSSDSPEPTERQALPVVSPRRENWTFSSLLKNALLFGILYIPFTYAYLLILYGMVSVSAPTMHLTGGETYGSLQGGILYQFLMWFSWGIYSYWEPRSVFTFHEYFRYWPSLLAPFLVYAMIAHGFIKKNLKNPHFLALFIALLFSFIMVKGPQEPFGAVYMYLIDHASIFRAFRSPDSKFGFVIVLTLAILLLFVIKHQRQKLFILLLAIVILIQGYPLFTGKAIRGENTAHSSDRIIHIPKEYEDLASFLNAPEKTYGYVTTLPSVEFGHFDLGDGEKFIGQDLLPKLIRLPFVYLSESGSLPVAVYRELTEGSVSAFELYPIRYYIFSIGDRGGAPGGVRPPKHFDLTFQNALFQVYENSLAPALFQRTHAVPVTFERVSPVEYRILLTGLRDREELLFHENYSRDWKLLPSTEKITWYSSWQMEESRDILHTRGATLSNVWAVDPATIKRVFPQNAYRENPDGSLDVEMTLYFKPELYLHIGLIVSSGALLAYLLYIGYYKWRKRKDSIV